MNLLPNRTLGALIVVTAVVVVAAGLSISERHQQAALAQKEGGLVFPALQQVVNTIAVIEVARGERRFTLERQAQEWRNLSVGGFPARQALIEKMIGGLASLTYFDAKTTRPKLFPQLEVEDIASGASSTQLTVKDRDGAVLADVIVGKRKINVAGLARQGVYIRLPRETRAWLAQGTLDVRYDGPDWSERTLVDVPAKTVKAITIAHPQHRTIEITQAAPGSSALTLKGLPANAKIEHQYQIGYLAGLLAGITFSDARRAKEIKSSFKNAFRTTLTATSGLVVIVRATEINADGTVWAQFDAALEDTATQAAEHEAARIKSALAGWAFKLPHAFSERLKIRLSDIIIRSSG